MIQASFEKTGAGKLPVYVIGHKNPDTDAICSAIGCAELLRLTRYPDAVAACCGGLNPRTRWVLARAGSLTRVLQSNSAATVRRVVKNSSTAGSPAKGPAGRICS